jgi:uncharacterized cupin superfamily protein
VAINLSSSAPHIFPAAAWDTADGASTTAFTRDSQSRVVGLVLHHDPAGALELGVRRWHPGASQETAFPMDEMRYFMKGHGIFRARNGEIIEVEPGTAVHFKQGWAGEVEASEPLDASYMRCEGGPADRTPVLRNVLTAAPLNDWGPVSKPMEGASRTAGILLSREPDMHAESGIWACTPGVWRCEVNSDEFCHFLEGSLTYTHDNGEVIEIKPDTLAYFPRGFKGRCSVHQTARKVYMIR